MSIFSIIGDLVSGVGSAVSSVINSLNAPESEKNKIRQSLNTQLNILKIKMIDAQTDLEKEITQRQKNDMVSDSWLSKNIRPLTLIYLLFLLSLFAVGNWYGYKIDSSFVEIIKVWGGLAVSFYFGGRIFNKFQKIKNK